MQAAELTVEVVVRCPSCHSDDHQIQRRHAKDDGVVQCLFIELNYVQSREQNARGNKEAQQRENGETK